jgi:NTE family protein
LGNIKQQAKEYSNSFFRSRSDIDESPSLFYSIANSIYIVQDRITRSRLAGDPAEVLLSPQLAHIGMLELHHAAETIKEGEDCVHKALAEIHRVIGR